MPSSCDYFPRFSKRILMSSTRSSDATRFSRSCEHSAMILTLAAAITIEARLGVNLDHATCSGHCWYRGSTFILTASLALLRLKASRQSLQPRQPNLRKYAPPVRIFSALRSAIHTYAAIAVCSTTVALDTMISVTCA